MAAHKWLPHLHLLSISRTAATFTSLEYSFEYLNFRFKLLLASPPMTSSSSSWIPHWCLMQLPSLSSSTTEHSCWSPKARWLLVTYVFPHPLWSHRPATYNVLLSPWSSIPTGFQTSIQIFLLHQVVPESMTHLHPPAGRNSLLEIPGHIFIFLYYLSLYRGS